MPLKPIVTRLAALLALALPVPALAQTTPEACTPRPDKTPLSRIVGGASADPLYWPGLATLRYRAPGGFSSTYFCGGTLINEEWLVTAAHCFGQTSGDDWQPLFERMDNGAWLKVSGGLKGSALEVVIGEDSLINVSTDAVFSVADVIVHPDYKDATSGHDIALVKLTRPWEGPIMAVSFDPATDPRGGAETFVGGFGFTEEGAGLGSVRNSDGELIRAGSAILLETSLPIVPPAQCHAR